MAFNLKSTKTIKIGDKSFQVSYPTVGQIIAIENKKMFLTNDKYVDYVANSLTLGQRFALDLVDVLSTFTVLIPELSKELAVDNVLDLDPITGKALIAVYKNEFLPWWSELQKVIHETVTKVNAEV